MLIPDQSRRSVPSVRNCFPRAHFDSPRSSCVRNKVKIKINSRITKRLALLFRISNFKPRKLLHSESIVYENRGLPTHCNLDRTIDVSRALGAASASLSAELWDRPQLISPRRIPRIHFFAAAAALAGSSFSSFDPVTRILSPTPDCSVIPAGPRY
jgi:hypothetical protein